MGGIRVGCCGFPSGMQQYFGEFDLVEVQQTFYQPPQVETLRCWRQRAPQRFEFALKAWQLVTYEPTSPTYRRLRTPVPVERADHYGAFRPTEEVWGAWETTRRAAEALAATVVVFQCPASFRPTAESLANLRRFFGQAAQSGLRFVWEPRGAWPDETVAQLASELGLVVAVDPFVRPPLAGPRRYLRLHGGPGYRHQYTDAELQWLADLSYEADTHCLFNNLSMRQDALRFKALLGQV